MERLISQALVPVVQALEATGEINGKLIWSNTGYLINWYLTEMKQLLDKRRPRANVSQVMHIIGDVAGRDCVLVDDMIDTGGTLCKAAEALKERGAKRVFAYATHPIFSGNAANNLRNSVIDEVVVCDTIPLSDEIKSLPNVRTLTLSGMLAEAIRRISNEESISAMFEH